MHVHVFSWFWKHLSFFRSTQQTCMWPARDSHSIKAHEIFKKSDPSRSTRQAHLCLSVSFFSSWNLVLIFHEDQVQVPVNHQARNLVSSIEALQILASALKVLLAFLCYSFELYATSFLVPIFLDKKIKLITSSFVFVYIYHSWYRFFVSWYYEDINFLKWC